MRTVKSTFAILILFFLLTGTALAKKTANSPVTEKKTNVHLPIKRQNSTRVDPLVHYVKSNARDKPFVDIKFSLYSGYKSYEYKLTLNQVKLDKNGGYLFIELPANDVAYSYMKYDGQEIINKYIKFSEPGTKDAYLRYTFSTSEINDERQLALGFTGEIEKTDKSKLLGVGAGVRIVPSIYSWIVVSKPSTLKKNKVKFGDPELSFDSGSYLLTLPVENQSEHTLSFRASYSLTPPLWESKSTLEKAQGVPPHSKFLLTWSVKNPKFNKESRSRVLFKIEETLLGASFSRSLPIDITKIKNVKPGAKSFIPKTNQSLSAADATGKFLAWPVVIENLTDKLVHVELLQIPGEMAKEEGGFLCSIKHVSPYKSVRCGVYLKNPGKPAEMKNLPFTIRLRSKSVKEGGGDLLDELKIDQLNAVSAQ